MVVSPLASGRSFQTSELRIFQERTEASEASDNTASEYLKIFEHTIIYIILYNILDLYIYYLIFTSQTCRVACPIISLNHLSNIIDM